MARQCTDIMDLHTGIMDHHSDSMGMVTWVDQEGTGIDIFSSSTELIFVRILKLQLPPVVQTSKVLQV